MHSRPSVVLAKVVFIQPTTTSRSAAYRLLPSLDQLVDCDLGLHASGSAHFLSGMCTKYSILRRCRFAVVVVERAGGILNRKPHSTVCRPTSGGPGSNTGTARVVAVGSHSGASANKGHWTAAHRVRGVNDQANATPEWLRFNDGIVSSEKVKNNNSDHSKRWRKEATVVAYATVPGTTTTSRTTTTTTKKERTPSTKR